MPSPLFNKYYAEISRSNDPYHTRVSIDTVDKMIRRRNYREFLEFFKALFLVIREQNIGIFKDGDQNYFTELFQLWFKALERPGLILENDDINLFLLNANITNLLAATPLRNGDACLKNIISQPNNMVKLLLLYTPRSLLQIPVKPLFDANPFLASLWYSSLWNWTDTYVSQTVQRNMEYFLANIDDRLEPFDSNMVCGYFRCTYVDSEQDKRLKQVFCKAIDRYTSAAHINNNPNPKSIAIMTGYWNSEHAVYRAFAPYVEELARHYDLTLINLKPNDPRPARTEFFKKVYSLEASTMKIDISTISNNNFQLAYFPDVGISAESLYIANMRIAPIQCMGTGHPVSSCSPAMDYFISGSEVETPDQAERNYNERLVLLPGLSVNPLRPNYTLQHRSLAEEFIINLPWMHMKNNFHITQALRRIHDKATKKIIFAVFPGVGITKNSAYMATIQDFSEILPREAVIVHPDYKYPDYMAKQEEGRFSLHSYPFGGGTTAVDALVQRKPLLVLRGRYEYNRYSAALLERLGLADMVTDSMEQWEEICLRLIDDDAYLADMTRRFEEVDLEEKLFKMNDPTHLRRAFDQLIKYDPVLRKDTVKTPITID